jgi:antitoxin PrlF
MATTTLTSKGQLTLPKEIRERLDWHEGDRFTVDIEDGRAVLTRAKATVDDLMNVLPKATRKRSIEEMDQALRSRARKRK